MPNFIYEFIQDSSGSCAPCTGGCAEVITTGSGCFTCSGSGCIYYKCVCAAGTAPAKVPCSVLMHYSGCINKYTYRGDTGNCYYHACDDTVWTDLDQTQIVYDRDSGHWKTLGYPPQDDFFTRAACGPLGEYGHPSGWYLEVTICTWCSGCDCGPSGSGSPQRGGDAGLSPPCDDPSRDITGITCAEALCWTGGIWQADYYAVYGCELWRNDLDDNTIEPGLDSSWALIASDCCTGVPTGCGPAGWHSSSGCLDA